MLTRDPAHCRRRKIRCLLAEGDSQDRCQNCIRLKKECVFYPVDQQQMLDTRSQSGAKSGPGSVPSSAVSPSPPELASGRPFERSRQYGSFPSLPSLPSNAPPGPGFGVPLGHGATFSGQGDMIPGHPAHTLSNHESVGMPPAEYGFQPAQQSDGQRHWEQVNDLSSPSAPMNRARDSMQSQYYRSSPTVPSTADFAPFPNSASSGPQMQHSEGAFQYPINQAQAQAWNQSQMGRSMSYNQLQDVGPQGYMPSSVGYPPQASHEGQPTVTTSFGSSNATQAPTLAPHQAPMGNPMMTYGQQHPYMFQQPSSVAASPISSHHPYGNHWYGEPSPYGASEQAMRSPADHRSFTSKPGQ
jgi:hypothetical protein